VSTIHTFVLRSLAKVRAKPSLEWVFPPSRSL